MKRALFAEPIAPVRFPSTRYQGSKAKLADWVWSSIEWIDFDSALDAFGGSGAVAYRLKQRGKQVTYNDYLRFNYLIGLGLIENSDVRLDEADVASAQTPKLGLVYDDFIERTFKGTYYQDDENRWLDVVAQNLKSVKNKYKRALLYSALFQACIVKRPFNLFHRSNLYLRTADVKRTFGNKTTWDRPFPRHLEKFAGEMSDAVFDNGLPNKALCCDVFDIDAQSDLVYLDPPYIHQSGRSVDYHEFYHFLEGLVDYPHWEGQVDWKSKHRRLKPKPNPWNDPKRTLDAFRKLFDKFRKSAIALSYRSDGIPTVSELQKSLKGFKNTVLLRLYRDYKYVLSHSKTDEVLLIGY